MISRRDLVVGSAAYLALAAPLAHSEELGLHARASRKGLYFGAAVRSADLRNDRALAEALTEECNAITPEWELKWRSVQAVQGQHDFRAAEQITRFAASHEMRCRGHALVWYRSVPDWASNLSPSAMRQAIEDHIAKTCMNFAGHVLEWDVVNEALDPSDGLPNGLRDCQLYRTLGPSYLSDSFHLARKFAPGTALVYNDYGLDYADRASSTKREAILRLLSDFRSRKVPVDRLGIQAHLVAGRTFDAVGFRKFLNDVAQLDFSIVISELDVRDEKLPSDIRLRDQLVSSHVRSYLDVALDERAVSGVVTWGLSDRYSWLNEAKFNKRNDGQRVRGLPLDDHMARKPLWHAIAAALDGAPLRG